jgi:hypothetical protein
MPRNYHRQTPELIALRRHVVETCYRLGYTPRATLLALQQAAPQLVKGLTDPAATIRADLCLIRYQWQVRLARELIALGALPAGSLPVGRRAGRRRPFS